MQVTTISIPPRSPSTTYTRVPDCTKCPNLGKRWHQETLSSPSLWPHADSKSCTEELSLAHSRSSWLIRDVDHIGCQSVVNHNTASVGRGFAPTVQANEVEDTTLSSESVEIAACTEKVRKSAQRPTSMNIGRVGARRTQRCRILRPTWLPRKQTSHQRW